MEYIGVMDPECIELCDAINLCPGIQTIESCCGHGKAPYRIWIYTKDLEKITPVLYYADSCHGAPWGWEVCVTTDCGMSFPKFLLEGPVGDYVGADCIAQLINKFVIELKTEGQIV